MHWVLKDIDSFFGEHGVLTDCFVLLVVFARRLILLPDLQMFYNDVCVPKSKDEHELLRSLFDETFGDWVLVSHPVLLTLILSMCWRLKNGKAAGLDGLTAEHIRFAHPVLLVHLARLGLFSLLYKFSMVPDDFNRMIVIILLKNVDGNRFTTNNYRGITLSPVISKLFEMVLYFRNLNNAWFPILCSLALVLNLCVVMRYLRLRL